MAKRSRSPSQSQSNSPSSSLEPEIRSDSISIFPSPSSSTVSTSTATLPPANRSKILHRDTVPFTAVMHCALPPHRETIAFASYEDYEVHYQQAHVNRCSQCSKNFPTAHFLNLHIEENHDSLAAAMRARGEKTYGCFIETCERKCSTPQKRRLHLIDKHMFPRDYNFYIINDGIDKQTSLLRPLNKSHRRRISSASVSSIQEGRLRRRSSASQPTVPRKTEARSFDQSEDTANDMDIDGLAQSMSALRFVPASVMRNRGKIPLKKA